MIPADPTDRRREKTRHAVRAAFFQLLRERGFDGLTVADVVERANVGRSTFYEHYRTKHDLLSQSLAGPFGLLAGLIGSPAAPATLVPLLLHFRENQRFGRGLFLDPTRLLVGRALAEQVERRLEVLCREIPEAAPILPLALIARQLAEAQLALVEPWTLGQISCAALAVAEALVAGSNGAAASLLRCALSPIGHRTETGLTHAGPMRSR